MRWGLYVLFLVLGIVLFAVVGVRMDYSRELRLRSVESVSVSQVLLDDLGEAFSGSTEEFVWCLEGEVVGGVVFVTGYFVPEVSESSEGEVHYASCKSGGWNNVKYGLFLLDDGVVGTVHNHINGNCMMSFRDAYTFGSSDDELMGIICDSGEYSFYGYNNLIEGTILEVVE